VVPVSQRWFVRPKDCQRWGDVAVDAAHAISGALWPEWYGGVGVSTFVIRVADAAKVAPAFEKAQKSAAF